MSDNYNPKSCNALEKPFYHPIEAAIRWCGLIEHEDRILEQLDGKFMPEAHQFRQWPCLRANTAKIIDGMQHGDLPYGRDGKTVPKGEQVATHRQTVRHTDLKNWMSKHFPDQKPAFLFDEIERQTHAAYTAENFNLLRAERDAARSELERKQAQFQDLNSKYEGVLGERDSLKDIVEKMNNPGERAETTYLNIIGAFLDIVLGIDPKGEPYSSLKTQDSIISVMLGYHGGKPGISPRTLQDKFAAAKRSVNAS